MQVARQIEFAQFVLESGVDLAVCLIPVEKDPRAYIVLMIVGNVDRQVSGEFGCDTKIWTDAGCTMLSAGALLREKCAMADRSFNLLMPSIAPIPH